MRSPSRSNGQTGYAADWNGLRQDAYGASMLLAHQQSSPGLTLYVEPGVCYVGATRIIFAGGSSPSFSAPSAGNKRIDLLTINSAGTLAITQGTPTTGTPSAPAYPTDGSLVLCEVYNRAGESSIKDVDDTTNGYVYNDVRPILGSNINFGAIPAHIIPLTDNTYDLGASGTKWRAGYFTQVYQNGLLAASAQFGGTGADGALNISSGTTTINLGGASYYVLNYTSISITGTAKLTFSNPSNNGCVIVIKCQGNCTISSTQPGIDASGMGGQGGAGGVGNNPGGTGYTGVGIFDDSSHHGAGGAASGTTNAGGVVYLAGTINFYSRAANQFYRAIRGVCCGSGAGGGGGSTGGAAGTQTGGAGGAGGAALILQVAGALNFSGTISVAGKNGGNGTSANGNGNSFSAGGGGGGAGGFCLVLYNSLNANSGTILSGGGSGGNGGDANSNNQAHGETGNYPGGGAGAGADGGAGGEGGYWGHNSQAGGNAGGRRAGGGGGGGVTSQNQGNITGGVGGSAGASENVLVVQNDIFA